MTFAASTRIRLVETSSGRADSRYPDGNDGSGAIPLEWASIPDTSFLQGVPGSINFLTYLTQPVPNTAAFSLLQNGAVTGVSLGTTSLDYSGTGTGSGIYQVRASRLGVQVDSRAFIVTCTAPASTDITAPTIPTGLTAVASLVGVNPVVTVTFDAFSDPAVTGQTTSGAKQGDVLRNGIQVGTVAVSAGVPLQATNTDIGSPAGAGSVLQSGSSYTVTGGGTGVGSTSDVCAFANVQVTGDFLITATLASVTGTTVNATAGLMVRSALSATERAVMLLVSPTRVRTRTRVTAGTATTPSTPYDGVTWPVTLKMQRIGDVITTYFLQGSAWQLIDTDTVSMGTAVFIGLYATYGASGTPTVDALFTQVNLVTNNVSSLTFTDTVGNGLAFSTAYTYTVRSEDLAGNISAVSPSVNVTTPDNPTPVIPLRLYMDFESGSIAPGDPSGNPPVVTTTEHLTGTRCMMSFLDKNNSANKFRTEIDLAQDNAAGTAPFLKHCWYGFALKLPANYNALISNQGEVQAQWHASEDAGEAALNPVIALYFEDGRYRLGMIGDSRQGAALVKPYETSTFGVVPNSVSFDPILGAWQRFVLHVVWNPQKTPPAGLVQFWRNGVSIVNQPTRQIGFNDIRGPYMKIGMYKSAWKDAAVRAGDPVSTRTIFHDEIRIVYDVVDGYDLVYPA